ncbi:MAG: V-type ATP synthase subunit E [bacterium]
MDDAHREAESIIEKAKEESKSIRKQGMNTVNDLKNKKNHNLSEVKLSGSHSKLISLEEFRARSEILSRKEEIFKEVLWQIREEFFSLPKRGDYPGIMRKLIVHAMRHLKADGETFLCRVNARDRALLARDFLETPGRELGKELSLDQDYADIVGGVIVLRSDLRVLYDNSLEAIFERNRQQMRCIAAECIFGKD